MDNLGTLRSDLAALLEPLGIANTRIYATVPDSIVGKSAIIFPETVIYDDTFNETARVTLIVQLLAPTVAAISMQGDLDDMLSSGTASSVIDALRSAGRYRLAEMRNYGTVQIPDGGSRYYSAELVVDVLA